MVDLTARPTLKVMKALSRGWTNPAHQRAVGEERILDLLPLADLGHPIITQAALDTAGGPNAAPANRILVEVREQTGEAWLEIKKERTEWRGAVAYDKEGQAWLVYATPRGHDAFYRELRNGPVTNGVAQYMPTERDYGYLALERQRALLRRWRRSNLMKAVTCVVDASLKGSARVELAGHPDTPDRPAGVLHLEVDRSGDNASEIDPASSHDDPADIRAYLTFSQSADKKHEALLARDLRALLQPREEAWDVDVAPDGTYMYSAYVPESRLLQLAAADLHHGEHGDEGTSPPTFARIEHAHYTTRLRLAEATVLGKPVRSVCGFWFVPSQDHLGLPVCPKCDRDVPAARYMRSVITKSRRPD